MYIVLFNIEKKILCESKGSKQLSLPFLVCKDSIMLSPPYLKFSRSEPTLV